MTSTLPVSRILALLATLVFIASRPSGAQFAQGANGAARRVAIATHALARGAVLGEGDLEYRDTTIHAAIDTNHVAPGWVTRRVIAAGEVLRAPAVEPPIAVVANQPVSVEWIDDNISLVLRGIATRSASLGTRISVRLDNGRRVDGTVVSAGKVRID